MRQKVSEEKSSKSNNRPRRRRKSGGNRKKAPQEQTAQASGAPKRRTNRKRRSNNNKKGQNKGPQLSGLDRLIVKYENLRDQHIEARRKYYDLFERADPQQKDKLERVFTNTMVKLRDFEQNLKSQDKELFDQHYNGLKLDLVYSQNHQLDPQGDEAPADDEVNEDPHYLESQKMSNFSEDTEESMGTIEDYNSYKGL